MSSLRSSARFAGRGLLAAVLAAALVTPSASASGRDVWKECRKTGAVTTNHSQEDFKEALTDPPADGAEYTGCIDQIQAAQNAKAQASNAVPGASGGGGGASSGGSGGAAATPSAAGSTTSVEPQALEAAISKSGIDPAAAVGAVAPAPAPLTMAGESINLADGNMPSLANAFSLPLPVAASAVIVMLAAALPVVRFVVARYGGVPNTVPTTPPAP